MVFENDKNLPFRCGSQFTHLKVSRIVTVVNPIELSSCSFSSRVSSVFETLASSVLSHAPLCSLLKCFPTIQLASLPPSLGPSFPPPHCLSLLYSCLFLIFHRNTDTLTVTAQLISITPVTERDSRSPRVLRS